MHAATDFFQHFGIAADFSGRTAPVGPRPLRYTTRTPRKEQKLGSETFAPYRVQRVHIADARPHGAPLVESAALAATAPPVPTTRPILEPTLITSGALSDAQLEAIIYAVDAHEQTLDIVTGATPDHKPIVQTFRCGFFLGDGGGVGKGRMIAAVIAHNRNAGRPRAVWLSMSDLLVDDARRDWMDLGEDNRDIVRWGDTALDADLCFERGILFGTYALLRQRKTIGRDEKKQPIYRRRVDQLIAALGPDFDGVIVFDEAHAAANADPGDDTRSLQGAAVLELQERLPDARILYVSATGASRVDDLFYAPRLGLWALGAPFERRRDFQVAMREGGLSAMELVAQYLRAKGRYISRTLSLQDVTYDRLNHELDRAQREWWDDYCKVWRLIEFGMENEVRELSSSTLRGLKADYVMSAQRSAIGKLRSRFRSMQLYAFSQALASLKMPSVIAHAKDAIARGKAVCLELNYTNEADLQRKLADAADDENLADLDLSHRASLVHFVNDAYPIYEYQARLVRELGGTSTYVLEHKLDAAGNPIENPDALARRAAIIESIENLVMPQTALEQLQRAFGDRLAEVTGRRRKLVYDTADDGTVTARVVNRGRATNRRETSAFQNNERDILVFSDAGGVGVSFHADLRCKNQRQREHIILEFSPSAAKLMQRLFRTHRTGAVSAPNVTLVTCDISGEMRFAAAAARNLAALGALSRGHRDASGAVVIHADQALDSEYGVLAMVKFFADIAAGAVDGLTRENVYAQTGLYVGSMRSKQRSAIYRVLNRILASSIGPGGEAFNFQAAMMHGWYARLEAIIESAIEASTFDGGLEIYTPQSLSMVHRERLSVEGDRVAPLSILTYQAHELPYTLTATSTARSLSSRSRARFRRDRHGVVRLCLPSTIECGVRFYELVSATDTYHAAETSVLAMPEVDRDLALEEWQAAVDAIPLTRREFCVLSGNLLAAWPTMRAFGLISLVRLASDDGETRIAIRLPGNDVERVRSAFAAINTAPALAA